jgi:hypothetical protein
MSKFYICLYRNIQMYVHYIDAKPVWSVFFALRRGTSRAHPKVCLPYFGCHWPRRSWADNIKIVVQVMVIVWTALIWLWVGSSGRSLWTRQMDLWVQRRRRISCLDVQLPSQKELCSMKLYSGMSRSRCLKLIRMCESSRYGRVAW